MKRNGFILATLVAVLLTATLDGCRAFLPKPDADPAAGNAVGEADPFLFESFDGTRIAYRDEGEGFPVVLLHGFLGTGASWGRSQLHKDLLAAGYRVIRPDLRGNGASDHPHNPEAYRDEAETRDLSALADQLSLNRFYVVGYSRGSIVLAEWLTREPRIARAVMGGMGLDFTDPDWDRRRRFADAFSGRAEPDSMTAGAVRYAHSIGADKVSLGLQQDFQPSPSVAELAGVEVPVLVIAGSEDTDNGSPAELQAAIPAAILEIVPGDHNGTYHTGAFADAILKFFGE